MTLRDHLHDDWYETTTATSSTTLAGSGVGRVRRSEVERCAELAAASAAAEVNAIAAAHASEYGKSPVRAHGRRGAGDADGHDEAMMRASWVMGRSGVASPMASYQSHHRRGMQEARRERDVKPAPAPRRANVGSDTLLSSQYHREKSQLQEMAARREAERAMAARVPTARSGRGTAAAAAAARRIDVFGGTPFDAARGGGDAGHRRRRRREDGGNLTREEYRRLFELLRT